MLKRMSILVRLPSDSRSTFSTKWQHHGTLVSVLPGIHSYIQNHVEEQFGDPAIKADGIVELRFSTLEAMNNAFSTEAAKPVRSDEPGFLGHGTGYILEADSPVLTAVAGNKLIVTLTNGGSAETAQVIEDSVGSLAGFRDLVRDRVSSILARDEMKEGPQCVDIFLHIYFDEAESAAHAGQQLAERIGFRGAWQATRVSIFRTRTITFI